MTFPPKGPAARFDHNGHVIRNINQEFLKKLTVRQRVSDRVARVAGTLSIRMPSWRK